MKDLVRTLRSGTVGLDLALGGGFRFVRRTRLGDRESATLLIRGGPGTGKSVLAQDLALRLAGVLGGDVLYACVEVLPSEVAAQRMGFEGYDPSRVVDLSGDGTRDPSASGPSLVMGLRDIALDEDGVPDLGQMLLDLARMAIERGFRPKIVVVDSLSDGYSLGNSAPRPAVDGVCKLAVEQGWGLILVEEVADDAVSPWAFAVDTVLSLRIALGPMGVQARREMLVTKHRFGSCEPGPHRLQINPERVRVIPPFSAYRNAVRDLVLPPPSRDRSLRVPIVGDPPDWELCLVPDSQGMCILLQGQASPEQLEYIAAAVGGYRVDGMRSVGHKTNFFLVEGTFKEIAPYEDGLWIGTLHQFIDGEDWLENAMDIMSRQDGTVSVVRVGPTQELDVYDYKEDLKKGISLFANILTKRGMLVVIFGQNNSASSSIRAGIVDDRWTTGPTGQKKSPIIISSHKTTTLRFTPVVPT